MPVLDMAAPEKEMAGKKRDRKDRSAGKKADRHMTELQQEIDRNYAAFMNELDSHLAAHSGQFALLHEARVVSFFQTWQDAYNAGQLVFQDKPFSVQKVSRQPVDLGYFSRV